eukprot:GHVP01015113.1.p1 GENE.GHVP01015113.1~~GHVP01015113.1.p1  ORF type:complete len:131 (+),score=29.45 GHVP01015113.1:45-437(+)
MEFPFTSLVPVFGPLRHNLHSEQADPVAHIRDTDKSSDGESSKLDSRDGACATDKETLDAARALVQLASGHSSATTTLIQAQERCMPKASCTDYSHYSVPEKSRIEEEATSSKSADLGTKQSSATTKLPE